MCGYNIRLAAQRRPPDSSRGCPSCDSGDGWNWRTKDEIRWWVEHEPDGDHDGYFQEKALPLEQTRFLHFECGYCSPRTAADLGYVPVRGDLVWDWCHDELDIQVVDIPEYEPSCLLGI
jgi:hypothetical protein